MVDLRKIQCIDRNLFDKQIVYEKGDWIKRKSIIELNSSNKWGNSMHGYYN